MHSRYKKVTENLIGVIKTHNFKQYKAIGKTIKTPNSTPEFIKKILPLVMGEAKYQDVSERDIWTEHTMADEYRWETSPEKNVLFIKNQSVFSSLADVKFSYGEKTASLVPFSSFEIILPESTMIRGREIEGILVNKFDSFHSANDSMRKLYDDSNFDLKPIFLRNHAMDDPVITICFSFKDEPFVASRVIAPNEVLNASADFDEEQFNNLMTKSPSSYINNNERAKLNADELITEQYIIRTVISVSALLHTESGKLALKKGFPENVSKKMKQKLKDCTVMTLDV
ncbi:hypothetical protein [Photobacterium kishitanii]|uniref:Uncharacterized protein n=1 Tax=Photobacterium kishitanii TaxID=318456 RepID=A0A2T3KLY2_9GAMM|nr:hypothetical protein [Photobacterium kishitanii]PSV00705.1 hypothetical protein C9J27_06070 [Photobacterium kishitanii]